MGEGEGKKLVQYCNQWPAMLDFESVLDRGFQVLKYYFYVSVSFAGSVFHWRNWVDWLLAMSMLNYLTVCVRFVLTKWFEVFVLSF